MESQSKNPAMIAGMIIFAIIFLAIIFKFMSQARRANDEQIAEQIKQLDAIFKNINDTCRIIKFRRKKNYVDFLNVQAFKGSVVGSMNVEKPEKWAGPYLEESLTSAGREYQIIATKKGYYLVPGDGVRLSNGQVIGKSLQFDYKTDMEALMRDPKALLSQGQPLAAFIETVQNPFEALSKGDFLEEEIGTSY